MHAVHTAGATLLLQLAGALAPAGLVSAAPAAAVAPAVAPSSGGEDDDGLLPAEDPYTAGDEAAIRAAGYTALGELRRFGDEPSRTVDQVLGLRVLWVETEHFQIGSTLGETRVSSDRAEKARIAKELERLRARLPEIPDKVKKLDPWLRLHLFAMRCEDLYAEVLRLYGGEPGPGAYLGQEAKFCVLLTTKESTFQRFAVRFLGGQVESLVARHLFAESGALLYAASFEQLEGDFERDLALHCVVAFGVAQNLVDGYGGYVSLTPIWWRDGLAHHLSRSIDPRFNVDGQSEARSRLDPKAWKWDVRTRKRVKHDANVDWETMLGWGDGSEVSATDRMAIWSRAAFLLEELDGAGAFVRALRAEPLAVREIPKPDAWSKAQRPALEKAFGMDIDALDAAWKAHVNETYPRR